MLLEKFINVDFLLFDKVVLNINGLQHYRSDDIFKLNVKSIIKEELLRKKGYYVVTINCIKNQEEGMDINFIIPILLTEMENQMPEEAIIKYNIRQIFKIHP